MPWGRLDDSLYDHPKLDEIPVEHRLAAIGLWARAISWCNRYLTDGHVPRAKVLRLDGTPELAEHLVAVGLFDENGTGYVIHDFLEFNDSRADVEKRRKEDAERKARWRADKASARSHGGTSRSDGSDVTLPVRSESRRESQRDSRARVRARESRPDPTRPVPSESLPREDPRAQDIAALHELGWKRVTRPQRAVLAEVADRHRRDGNDGTWFAAEAIRAAGEADPLEAVMTADRLWQQAQRRRADSEDAAWQATKAEDRRAADRLTTDDPPDWARRSA